MKLSIFTTLSNPGHRQDPYKEALACYADLADELVVVDGGKTPNYPVIKILDALPIEHTYIHNPWPHEFDWPEIGQQFQRGYQAATGDWVIRMDLDYFFHENDFHKLRTLLENNPNELAFSFWKYQFLLVDRYQIKSRPVLAVNKASYGDRIRLNGGGDLCAPTKDYNEIPSDTCAEARIPIYNYDFCFKEESIIKWDFARFCRAWGRHFGDYPFGGPTEEEAIEGFKKMMVGRFEGRGWEHIKLDQHPKYIQETIRTMKKNRFGYNMFGWVNEKAGYYQ